MKWAAILMNVNPFARSILNSLFFFFCHVLAAYQGPVFTENFTIIFLFNIQQPSR